MTNSTVPDKSFRLLLPRLSGHRESAVTFLEPIPVELNEFAELDGTNALSLAQGFVDELVKQLVEVRDVKKVRFTNISERTTVHVQRSATIRGYMDRVEIL